MINKIITGVVGVLILLISEYSFTETTEINVLATTDLHGMIPYELVSYVKDEYKKDPNITLVDAGDFFDSGVAMGGTMEKYFKDRRQDAEKYLEVPIAKEMKEVGYDAVVLGNHEFVANNKFHLDNMISDFEKQGITVLSANTYENNSHNYVKPYIIKDINTPEGIVRLGILGLTIKEVGEKYNVTENGELVEAKSKELKDQHGYEGKLYMNDLVEDAKKWVNVMKEDKADVILAVVHSGEKPKKPKNPGNRIQELAREVDGIDAIVAGHTHIQIPQHDYKNSANKTVIVTQPGNFGECISKINFKLEKNNHNWDVVNKSSKITKFGKNQEVDKFGALMSEVLSLDNRIEEISLAQVTPFQWDNAYVFAPYTPIETIYKTVGYKWRDITQTEDDDMIQMIFMQDEKPICYVYGHTNQIRLSVKFDKSEYKNNVVTIFAKDNDKFKVEKEVENFITHLNHIKQ